MPNLLPSRYWFEYFALFVSLLPATFCFPIIQNPLKENFCLNDRNPRLETTSDRRWEVLPIGVVRSPYINKWLTPKQATISRMDGGAQNGSIELFKGFELCLDHLDGFDYIWAITFMHLNSGYKNLIKPKPIPGAKSMPPESVGLFSSRAPHRPNPLALSALKVTGVDIERGIIHVYGIDLIEGTPVLDIKPYIPAFDSFPSARAGWMDTICPDPLVSRSNGYQDIQSARGARMRRAEERNKNRNLSQPLHLESFKLDSIDSDQNNNIDLC